MKKFLLLLILSMLAGVTAACGLSFAESAQSRIGANARNPVSTNLVGLFLVKKDNLKNQFRGEVYPIALYLNGRYVDVSNDLTREIREGAKKEYLLKLMQQKSFFNAVKDFTVVNQDQKIGEFEVNNLAVSQFACTSMVTGQGKFASNTSLQQVYEKIPSDRSGGFAGSIGKKQFDETWRWAIASSQDTLGKSASPVPSQADEARYRQDMLNAAKTLISQSSEAQTQKIVENEVLESMTVLDLNQDGRPEVFGVVRKGEDPRTAKQLTPKVYSNLWLNYSDGQPRVMSSKVQLYRYTGKPPYNLAGILDVNGDGISEVIVRTNEYEASNYIIYEYRNDQLNEVFNGAGYGC